MGSNYQNFQYDHYVLDHHDNRKYPHPRVSSFLFRKSFKENPRLMSYSKAFSGGLFLCVGLLHLLPEANENFNEYYA